MSLYSANNEEVVTLPAVPQRKFSVLDLTFFIVFAHSQVAVCDPFPADGQEVQARQHSSCSPKAGQQGKIFMFFNISFT